MKKKAIFSLAFMGVVFIGSPVGATLPLTSGFYWGYAYTDSICITQGGGGEVGFSSSSSDTTRRGILTMLMQAVTIRSDSTFFSIAYLDTGTKTAHYQWSVMGQSGDTISHSKYVNFFNKDYVAVKGTVFSKDSNGSWQVENDAKLSYFPQPDSVVGDTQSLSRYSRKTFSFGWAAPKLYYRTLTDTVKCFERIISSYLWLGFNTSTGYDTIRWAENVGLVNSSDYQKYSSDFIESSGSLTRYTHFSLFCFWDLNGVRVCHSPSAITTANNRRPLFRKNVVLGYPALRSSSLEVYNLNGQKVKNRVGRQLLIITH